MWSIMFLILFFASDKRLILATFLIASIVQGIESYFDYKTKQGYQTILIQNQDKVKELFEKIIYPMDTNIEYQEDKN